jgi:hypothetical protein
MGQLKDMGKWRCKMISVAAKVLIKEGKKERLPEETGRS